MNHIYYLADLRETKGNDMSNRQLEENREAKYDRILANHLGITYSEIGELEWAIDANKSRDEHIYSYLLKFSDGSPINITKK
ncbi:MAG: hypothetical protein L3J66_14020 [Bacteroidales bacterium]|nr:hypothetical protein [Bacteroidales bacterium]